VYTQCPSFTVAFQYSR